MDASLYQRLLPYVCALADETLQVNVNTLQPAQAALLAALFPAELTLAEARQLLQARAATGWNSVAAFLSQPLLQNRYRRRASVAGGAQRALYRHIQRGDGQRPLSATQSPAKAGANLQRRPAALRNLLGSR